MRPLKLLIASIVLAAGVLVWLSTRKPDAHVAAGTSGERATLAPPSSAVNAKPASPSAPVATRAFSYWGRVLGADSGLPIVGAGVTLQFGAPRPEQRTDAQGFFHIAELPGAEELVRIDAPGFGPRFAEVRDGHATTETAEVFRLRPAAALDAFVLDARGQPLAGVCVSLSTDVTQLGWLAGPDFHNDDTVIWSADTRDDGKCSIEGVAAGVHLTTVVRRGSEELYRAREPLTLEHGKRRVWRCTIGGRGRLIGVVLDQDERPVATELWLVSDTKYRESQSTRRRLDWSLESSVAHRCASDVAGAFVLDGVPSGAWWVGPAPTRREPDDPLFDGRSDPPRPDTVAPVATSLVIDDDAVDQNVVLRVHRGLFIRGRVIRPDGSMVQGARVSATSGEFQRATIASSSSDGTFTLGPFVPGQFGIYASSADRFAQAPPAIIQAGDEGVVLTLSQSGVMDLRAVDAQSGERCDAVFWIQAHAPVSFARAVGPAARGAASAFAPLSGLLEGVYDISAHTDDGRVGVARDIAVVVGRKLAGATVRVEPGAKLRVRLEGPAQRLELEVVNDGVVFFSEGLATSATRLAVVPAGVSTMRLKYRGNVLEERQITALAGEDTEIVFHRD